MSSETWIYRISNGTHYICNGKPRSTEGTSTVPVELRGSYAAKINTRIARTLCGRTLTRNEAMRVDALPRESFTLAG